LKIWHLVAPAPFGGLERVVYALALGQQNAGAGVSVVALLDDHGEEPSIIDELRKANVPVIPLVHPARSYIAQRRSLEALARELRPDVVHSHGYLPDVLNASMTSELPFARVTTVHGFTGGGWRNRLYEKLQRTSFRRFDTVIAVSKKLAGELAHQYPRKSQPLPNAWIPSSTIATQREARDRLRLTSDAFNVGWVGRLSHEKGADVLLDAVGQLRDLPIRVSFVGDGSERRALELRARKLDIDAIVSWHGKVPMAGRMLPAFDLLVISSRTEGTPITLFEAIEAGVPVVASAVGGIPDVVASSEAILVAPEDAGGLASAIRQVYDSRDDAKARARNAKARLRRDFNGDAWIKSHIAIYESAIQRRAGR
jgi:glycosyltransferase involved in cell wall biosynthesis